MQETLEERIEDLEKYLYVEMEHRLHNFKQRLDGVYERLVVLANAESIVHIETDKWNKHVADLKDVKDDIHSALEKTATDIMKGKWFSVGG